MVLRASLVNVCLDLEVIRAMKTLRCVRLSLHVKTVVPALMVKDWIMSVAVLMVFMESTVQLITQSAVLSHLVKMEALVKMGLDINTLVIVFLVLKALTAL